MIIGLTGAVGAGKSTVARLFAAHGFQVLDVDDVAAGQARAQGLEPGEALRRVLAGDAALEGRLSEAVRAAVAAWCSQTQGARLIDAALLFEQELDRHCSQTICLRCPAEERRVRVSARPTVSAALFDVIERSQWPEFQKASKAGVVWWTNVAPEALEAQVAEFSLALRQRGAGRGEGP